MCYKISEKAMDNPKRIFLISVLLIGVVICAVGCADTDGNGNDHYYVSVHSQSVNDVFKHTIYTYQFFDALDGISTEDFYKPAISYPPIPIQSKYTHVLNFQMSPFMPPLMKPIATNGPLILYSDDMDVLVFSPMDNFFISLISYEDGHIRHGIEGEVESIPAGFSHSFILAQGKGINATIEYWGKVLRYYHHSGRPDRYADIGLSYLGYWTDNGAYYYYKTEPNMNEEDTLLAVRDDAVLRGIPYGYMQLDSWWYFKEPGLILPGGTILWEPQPQMFPQGLSSFRNKLGLPLIAHNRWFAIENAYRNDYEFVVDKKMALPISRGLFDHLMDRGISWGLFTYEQDWLMPQFWGIKYLRSGIDNAEQWMKNIHDAARDKGLTVQICMAGAANLMSALDLPAITTVRTSIDYRKGISKESYWPQFHTVNMLAWALRVWPFKDNFQSAEKFGEQEALISSLSAGMVGVGDKIGAADPTLLLRTCRKDGLLLKPDKPATPIDAMFLPHKRPFITTTYSERKGFGKWIYLAAYHLAKNHKERTLFDRLWALISYGGQDVSKQFIFPDEVNDWHVDLRKDLEIEGPVVVYNWRTKEAFVAIDRFDIQPIEHLYDYAYYVIAPIFSNEIALIGESEKFVTLADKRFSEIDIQNDSINLQLEGVPGEVICLKAFDVLQNRMLEESVLIGPDGTATVSLRR